MVQSVKCMWVAVVVAGAAAFAAETASAPARAIDRADAKSVARAWLEGMKVMDAKLLLSQVAPIDDKRMAEYVDVTLQMAAGKIQMRRLAAKLFADDPALPKARRYENVDLFIEALEKATPKVEGDHAVFELTQPVEGGAEMKVFLKKVNEAWWVDGPQTIDVGKKLEDPAKAAEEMARQRARVECQDEIIRRAQAGEFKSFGQMEKAFFDARRKAEEKLSAATRKKEG